MFKFLYTFITNPLGICENILIEWIILLFIGEIVHEIAWNVSPGGKFGSFIYWITKLIAFILIWVVIRILIIIVKFIIANWIWFVCGIAIIGVTAIIIAIVKHKKGVFNKCVK